MAFDWWPCAPIPAAEPPMPRHEWLLDGITIWCALSV